MACAGITRRGGLQYCTPHPNPLPNRERESQRFTKKPVPHFLIDGHKKAPLFYSEAFQFVVYVGGLVFGFTADIFASFLIYFFHRKTNFAAIKAENFDFDFVALFNHVGCGIYPFGG